MLSTMPNIICTFLGIAPLKQALPVGRVNAGPSGEMTPEMAQVFDKVFGPCREANQRVLEKYGRLVIS